MNLVGTKELVTERLLLRKIKKNDYLEAFNNWCNDRDVSRYTLWKYHENSEVTRNLFNLWMDDYRNNDTFKWIVELKDTHELIGTIDVASKKFINYGAVEIGYCYGKKYWNKGYATEALKIVIKYLFDEVDLDVIYAYHMSNNPNSGKVMKKAGMSYEGILRGRVFDNDGVRNDLISYSITKDEYLNNKEYYETKKLG